MRALVRGKVRTVSALLSVLALGVVFAGVLRAVPPGPLPRYPGLIDAVPHLNAVISVAAIGTILGGLRAVRAGRVRSHRRFMITSTGLFAAFLLLYLYKIVLEGTTVFTGPTAVKQFVYLPLLAIHIILAVVAVPLVIYVLLLAATHPIAELPSTPHPRYGRFAASFWLVSFVLGIVVYLLLYVLF